MHKSPDLYGILSVPATASPSEIKKAYYAKALSHHPDRINSKDKKIIEETTIKFQEIQLAYSILSDKEKKSVYDLTGSLDDDGSGYVKVSLAELLAFEKKYKGSENERKDLIDLYNQFKGNVGKIIDGLFFGHVDEEERYRKIIEEEIKKGNILPTKQYLNSFKTRETRVKKAEKEAKEAENLAKEMNFNPNGSAMDLVEAIKSKSARRSTELVSAIESKYVKGKGKRERNDEPTEEEFTAIQKKMFGNLDGSEKGVEKGKEKLEMWKEKPISKRNRK